MKRSGPNVLSRRQQRRDLAVLESIVREHVEDQQDSVRKWALGLCLVAIGTLVTFALAVHAHSTSSLTSVWMGYFPCALGTTLITLFFLSGMYRTYIQEPASFLSRFNKAVTPFKLKFDPIEGLVLRR